MQILVYKLTENIVLVADYSSWRNEDEGLGGLLFSFPSCKFEVKSETLIYKVSSQFSAQTFFK